jgi:hypothetical protein
MNTTKYLALLFKSIQNKDKISLLKTCNLLNLRNIYCVGSSKNSQVNYMFEKNKKDE